MCNMRFVCITGQRTLTCFLEEAEVSWQDDSKTIEVLLTVSAHLHSALYSLGEHVYAGFGLRPLRPSQCPKSPTDVLCASLCQVYCTVDRTYSGGLLGGTAGKLGCARRMEHSRCTQEVASCVRCSAQCSGLNVQLWRMGV